jgi:hypothetical protein
MSALPNRSPRPLPTWLMAVCSVLAVGHLLVIGLFALSASSGPWPVPPPFGGISPVDGPAFATQISVNVTYPYYLKPLHMTHNYHFNSNRPPSVAVYFEAHIKDDLGNERVLKFPDDKANFWVRHRQEILAQNLAQDQRMPPRGSMPIAAKGQELPKVEMWVRDKDNPVMKLEYVEEADVPRTQELEVPSAWSKAAAASYSRYLSREHKGASVQLIRYSRQTVMPAMMFLRDEQLPKDFFVEQKAIWSMQP